jgi:hypothetical protein
VKKKACALFVLATLITSGLISLPGSFTQRAAAQSPRRFIIDSHQHYSAAPDYIARLVKVYRARNAMACALTPMSGFEVVKKASADHPDVIIPYGVISVDNPEALAEIQKFAEEADAGHLLQYIGARRSDGRHQESSQGADGCAARHQLRPLRC